MGFFNDLTKKTSETTSKIAKKTSETTSKLAKETKLKISISEDKGRINDLYKEIGKKTYEDHLRNRTEKNMSIEDLCKQIDEISKEIEKAKKEILILNNRKNCSHCSAEIDKNAVFCPKCGKKQEVIEDTTEESEGIEEIKIEENAENNDNEEN